VTHTYIKTARQSLLRSLMRSVRRTGGYVLTGNSDVTPLGSSSRAPLLAPSPLRTGLEGFPFIRLEHPKTPP
jgi:hypothetical protein